MPRGRPKLTEEQRKKYRNITIDADLVDLLNAAADEAEKELGFRPTLSQLVRRMLSETAKKHQKVMRNAS